MFAMAGAAGPQRGQGELDRGVFARLKGGPCRTRSSDQRVLVPETGLYTYPDIVIVCGPEEFDPADPDTLSTQRP